MEENLLENNFRPDYVPYAGTVKANAPGQGQGSTSATGNSGSLPFGLFKKKKPMTSGQSQIAAQGIQTAGSLYGAKKGSDAATKSADMQTRAATEAARIQAQSSADQLAYFERQSELDRLSKRFADKQNYGLSKAGMENDFTRYGDTSVNARASERSLGKTNDNIYGGIERQKNFMRAMLGMPENPLSVYVEPDALQLTRPTLPDYVEDTTPTRTPIRTT